MNYIITMTLNTNILITDIVTITFTHMFITLSCDGICTSHREVFPVLQQDQEHSRIRGRPQQLPEVLHVRAGRWTRQVERLPNDVSQLHLLGPG